MRTPWFNRSLLLAFGASLGLHGAVLVGSRLVWRPPTLVSRADDGPQTLILMPAAGPAQATVAAPPSEPEPLAPPALPPPSLSAPEMAAKPPPPAPRDSPPVPLPEEPAEIKRVEPSALPPLPPPQRVSMEPEPASASAAPSPPPAAGSREPMEPLQVAAAVESGAVAVRAEPRYQFNPEPAYPSMARRRHQEGLVLLDVQVNAEGKAARVQVAQSSGHPLLDEAAQNAVRRWTFEPGRIGLRAVTSEIQVPVQFKLVER